MVSGSNLLNLILTSSNIRKGKHNVIVDALSRCYTILSQLDCRIFGLELTKGQYELYADFKDVFENCKEAIRGVNL